MTTLMPEHRLEEAQRLVAEIRKKIETKTNGVHKYVIMDPQTCDIVLKEVNGFHIYIVKEKK